MAPFVFLIRSPNPCIGPQVIGEDGYTLQQVKKEFNYLFIVEKSFI